MTVETTSSACSRGLVLFLDNSAEISISSSGPAEIIFLASARVLALAVGVEFKLLVDLRKKIWARDKIVGSNNAGCLVSRTKWQKSFGSSRVLRKAF